MGDLSLGEAADESAWRALVEQGLKGAPWDRLVRKTADGAPIAPLYREADFPTACDPSGFPGAAPFVRGAREGAWLIRQAYAHPDPERTNRDILTDLAGGVGAIELVIDPSGERGVAIRDADDFDLALADVILEAAPVSLDSGPHGIWPAEMLLDKLKGVAARGTAFNLDPTGAFCRTGRSWRDAWEDALHFTALNCRDVPTARFLRVDARIVHEAGGAEALEIAHALDCGIGWLHGLERKALDITQSARALSFAFSIGPDVLVEAAKLRAFRMCWARVLEASGAPAQERAAHIHAFTSRRMMTRHDAWTNIIRVTTAAFAAGIGGADAITTYPFTDALGLPTPFARRVARNTQHVILEECRLGHVADPAGGAWFVEKLTRDLADKAWAIMQTLQSQHGDARYKFLVGLIADARAARQRDIATRRETITGVTDYPLLGVAAPEVERAAYVSAKHAPLPLVDDDNRCEPLTPIRWAAPFEELRERAESKKASVFFANLGALTDFAPRAQFARNLLGAGGVRAIGDDDLHATLEALVDAFKRSGARAGVITGSDERYAEDATNATRALKAAGAAWLVLACKPSEHEAAWREAGVDQFVFVGQDALAELRTLHTALGVT